MPDSISTLLSRIRSGPTFASCRSAEFIAVSVGPGWIELPPAAPPASLERPSPLELRLRLAARQSWMHDETNPLRYFEL